MGEPEMLQSAREAIQRGDRMSAQKLLLQVIRANPRSETAWLWLSAIVDNPARERECLERVIALNPGNEIAQRHLLKLSQPVVSVVKTAAVSTAEPPVPSSRSPETAAPLPAPSLLELYGAGLVLPCISPAFYFHAARRRVPGALGFFLIFALIITLIQAVGVMSSFGAMGQEIEQAFASGSFPEITISRGQATIHGQNPFVKESDDGIVILDTTGKYTQSYLRSSHYKSGFLLTKTTLYSLGNGQVQSMKLGDFQAALGDPFTLNAQIVHKWFNMLQVMVALFLIAWNVVARLGYLAALALPVWGIANAIRRGADWAVVFTVGVYALVPTTYGGYLLNRAGVSFCGLSTLLLLVVWVIGLVVVLSDRQGGLVSGKRPLRSWRALIGVPMLLILVLDMIVSWPYSAAITWVVTALTLAALVLVGLWPILGAERA